MCSYYNTYNVTVALFGVSGKLRQFCILQEKREKYTGVTRVFWGQANLGYEVFNQKSKCCTLE